MLPLAARPAVSLSNPFIGRFLPFAASQEQRAPKCEDGRMSCPEHLSNVTRCPECRTLLHPRGEDGIHKMIHDDQLCHLGASNVTGFLAARDILGHFETFWATCSKETERPRVGARRVSNRLLRARLFGQPVPSVVEGCNILQNAKNVAFRCILLHGVASGVSRW